MILYIFTCSLILTALFALYDKMVIGKGKSITHWYRPLFRALFLAIPIFIQLNEQNPFDWLQMLLGLIFAYSVFYLFFDALLSVFRGLRWNYIPKKPRKVLTADGQLVDPYETSKWDLFFDKWQNQYMVKLFFVIANGLAFYVTF